MYIDLLFYFHNCVMLIFVCFDHLIQNLLNFNKDTHNSVSTNLKICCSNKVSPITSGNILSSAT